MYNSLSSILTWEDVLTSWEHGEGFSYPNDVEISFFYRTSVCNKDTVNSIYYHTFTEDTVLEEYRGMGQRTEAFEKYIQNSKSIYATSFNNLNNTSKLVIPIPRRNKQFTNIKEFMDNATVVHQKMFWRRVAHEIRKALLYVPCVYVNTHGLGINYFHLRIDVEPKYY